MHILLAGSKLLSNHFSGITVAEIISKKLNSAIWYLHSCNIFDTWFISPCEILEAVVTVSNCQEWGAEAAHGDHGTTGLHSYFKMQRYCLAVSIWVSKTNWKWEPYDSVYSYFIKCYELHAKQLQVFKVEEQTAKWHPSQITLTKVSKKTHDKKYEPVSKLGYEWLDHFCFIYFRDNHHLQQPKLYYHQMSYPDLSTLMNAPLLSMHIIQQTVAKTASKIFCCTNCIL